MKTTWISVTLLMALGVALHGCGPNDEPAREAPPAEQTPADVPATREAAPADVSPEAELEGIKARLETVKKALFDEGEYNCCVEPSCDWCALHEGSCACFKNLQEGEAVCPGCGLGWHNGQGIADVDPKSVKWEITHSHPASGGEHHHH